MANGESVAHMTNGSNGAGEGIKLTAAQILDDPAVKAALVQKKTFRRHGLGKLISGGCVS